MKSIKYFLLSLVIFLIGYILVKYIKYNNCKNVISSPEISFIKDATIGYIYNFYDESLDNKKSLQRMMDWSRENHGLKNMKILQNGFKIIFDKKTNSYVFYIFGLDKNDDGIDSTPFNFVDSKGYYHIKEIRFVDYLVKRDYDIILFNYKKSNCIKDNTSLKYEFVLYNGIQPIGDDELMRFKKIITLIQKRYSNSNGNQFDDAKHHVLYFKYDNRRVFNICDGSLSEKNIDAISKELQEYLDSINISYLDYAFFPIIIDNDNYTALQRKH